MTLKGNRYEVTFRINSIQSSEHVEKVVSHDLQRLFGTNGSPEIVEFRIVGAAKAKGERT